jgi:GntR family transcriptional regulator, arabinose operon transcriptional repressor
MYIQVHTLTYTDGHFMSKATDIQLHHDSFVSLHVQMHNQLRQLIVSGRWSKGTLIPSETQFSNHLKISRSTVRLALQQIELEGLIERRPGKGTFVIYQPSQESQKQLIAFVTNDFTNAESVNLLNGAENEIRKAGYHITFNNVQSSEEEIELLTRFQEQDVAGVLIWPNADYPHGREQHVKIYHTIDLPIVFLDRNVPGVDHDCVTSDNFGGATMLMQHLVELGHEQIVFLTHTKMDILPVMERYRAYQDVMCKAGLAPQEPWLIGHNREINRNVALVASTDVNSLEFQQIKNYLLNASPRPTAIFALNDYVAILAMRVVKHLNIKLPEEISIVGFDDIDLAAHLETPLTTIAQDSFGIGKRAAQLLIDRLDGYAKESICEYIPTQLRVRSSTSVYVPA